MPKLDNLSNHEVNDFYPYILPNTTSTPQIYNQCIDVVPYTALSFYLSSIFDNGPITQGSVKFQLTHSDTINTADFEDIPAESGFDSEFNPASSFVYAAADLNNTIGERLPVINLIGPKRYVSARTLDIEVPNIPVILNLFSVANLKRSPTDLPVGGNYLITKL